MSFTAFSTTTPQVGEEQPLSSTAKLVSSWTTLDILAAFPPAKTPYSAKALIVLGADLPSSGLLGTMRVRKFGDTTSYEEAHGALGITSIVYRDGGEYQSGGYVATITILVDTDGKFEYQLQNDSAAPRTMIRILEVTTADELPDATATPTADKIPIADGSGKLDSWVTIPSVPPAFEIVDALTVEVSHTGDTAETPLATLVVPGGKMGANGIVRINACFRGTGAGIHRFLIRFAGTLITDYQLAHVGFLYDPAPTYIWNQGATNAQDASRENGAGHVFALNPTSLVVDTTADVNITFNVLNSIAAGVGYLRFAVIEAVHRD